MPPFQGERLVESGAMGLGRSSAGETHPFDRHLQAGQGSDVLTHAKLAPPLCHSFANEQVPRMKVELASQIISITLVLDGWNQKDGTLA